VGNMVCGMWMALLRVVAANDDWKNSISSDISSYAVLSTKT